MSQSSKKQKVAKFRLAIIDDGVNKNNLGIALDLENYSGPQIENHL